MKTRQTSPNANRLLRRALYPPTKKDELYAEAMKTLEMVRRAHKASLDNPAKNPVYVHINVLRAKPYSLLLSGGLIRAQKSNRWPKFYSLYVR